MARFEDGVFNKREPGFFGFDLAEITDRPHLDLLTKHGLQLFQFAGIMAGQYQLFDQPAHGSGNTS